MSLKFFFHRNGPVVWGLTLLGWGSTLWHGFQLQFQWETRGEATGILFLLMVFFCLLILAIRLIPWYEKEDRGYGIEEHFVKTLVPTAYIMVAANVIYFFWSRCWPFLLFSLLLLSILLFANIILICFHFRDTDKTPPAYFARSLHMTDRAL